MVTFPAVTSTTEPAIAMTVLGPVPVAQLGIALPHEHLLIHIPDFIDVDEETVRRLQNEPVTLENLGWVRQYWTYSRDNLRMTSEPLATAEVARFAAAGGSTIVDVTVPGLGRDPQALARISRSTGLHIVMACGAYVAKSHPVWIADATESQLADRFVAEARDGVGTTGIKPGIIKVGCSWPLHVDEQKALRAAAHAQRKTGLAITLHPGRDRAAPRLIADILAKQGADLRRVVMGHLDGRVQDLDGLRELGERGLFLEFDVFGLETSYFPVPGVVGIDGLSDAQRLVLVRGLIDAGFGPQILLSHDIGTKHRLAAYGGHGFDHLVANVIPWMRRRGFTPEEIDMLFVRNPANLLTIRPAA